MQGLISQERHGNMDTTKVSKPKLRIVKDSEPNYFPVQSPLKKDDTGNGYTDGEEFIHREPVTEDELLTVIENLLNAK